MTYLETTRNKPAYTTGTQMGPPPRKPVNRYEDDATGINPEERMPIDSRMPHMPPA